LRELEAVQIRSNSYFHTLKSSTPNNLDTSGIRDSISGLEFEKKKSKKKKVNMKAHKFTNIDA